MLWPVVMVERHGTIEGKRVSTIWSTILLSGPSGQHLFTGDFCLLGSPETFLQREKAECTNVRIQHQADTSNCQSIWSTFASAHNIFREIISRMQAV